MFLRAQAGLQMWCGLKLLAFHTRCSTAADHIQQRRAAHSCPLSQFQVAGVLIRTAPDGGYWPVSDNGGLA